MSAGGNRFTPGEDDHLHLEKKEVPSCRHSEAANQAPEGLFERLRLHGAEAIPSGFVRVTDSKIRS